LTEPYVTTRVKGTGLGLAIVKKIMEDHEGELMLEDRKPEGAKVSLVFGVSEMRAPPRSGATEAPMELSPVSHGA
jgi:two-component system, NtrC family, nitrogen regulation sensor histidine kinase NtrY